jgi:hypothetical protein
MWQYILIIILIVGSAGSPVRGEQYTLPGKLVDTIAVAEPFVGSIALAWENDLYYQQDFYYTNGFEIEVFHEKLQQSPINLLLFPAGNHSDVDSKSGLQLRQEIFTPKDLAADTIIIGDHPYSSTLTLAQVKIYTIPDRRMRIESALRLGVLGPAALGFRTQELAHHVSNPSRPPEGWDNQLQNDIIVNYKAQVDKGMVHREAIIFGITGKGRLGTLHTDLEAGLWFRLDAGNGYFYRFGPSCDHGFNVKFFMSANMRHVFYDATLQGGVFNKTSLYIITPEDVSRWLGILEASATFELYEHQLEIFTLLDSKRFRLAEPHGWLGITYRYWF